MRLVERLLDAACVLLDALFRLLEWFGVRQPQARFERFAFGGDGDGKWNVDGSAGWIADAEAMGLYPIPTYMILALLWWPPDHAFGQPKYVLLLLRLPDPPLEDDDENHPIRGPPVSVGCVPDAPYDSRVPLLCEQCIS